MTTTHCSTEEMARKILLHSRRRITQLAPVLLESVYALSEKVSSIPAALYADGKTLWFCPQRVVEDFRADRDSVARQLLHAIAHCLLGHTELRDTFEEKRCFDWAADLKAAEFAEGLCGRAFTANRADHLGSLERGIHFSPLYETLKEGAYEGRCLRRIAVELHLDDHSLWSAEGMKIEGACAESGDRAAEEDCAAPDWERIRRSMLECSGGKLPGQCAGMLEETLGVRERGMSFAAFLKRFAASHERMLMDPDTFDSRNTLVEFKKSSV